MKAFAYLTLAMIAVLSLTILRIETRLKNDEAAIAALQPVSASIPSKTATIRVSPTIDSKGKIGLGVDLGAALKF